MAKVSVIIPVYNVYKYIDRCLESLVNQTFKDIEIIIVNDGSTDNIEEKLKKWSECDSRITVINNLNKGAAYSRNCGINNSKGEYVSFVDADDYCHQDMIEKLYNALVLNDADYVFCSFFKMYFDGRVEEIKQDITLDKPTDLKHCKELLFKVDPNVWNKLYKKSLIIDNNIFFNEDVLKCHDVPFTASILTKASKIVQITDSLYFYSVDRPNSITALFNTVVYEWEGAWPTVIDYFINEGIFKYYSSELEKRIIESCFYLIRRALYDSNNVELMRCAIDGHLKYLDSVFPNWKKNQYFDNNNLSILRKIEFFDFLYNKNLEKKPIVIFSASSGGKGVLSFLTAFNITPDCFCDNSKEKQNTFINGINILSPDEAIMKFGKNIYLLIASDSYFIEINDQMIKSGISDKNIF